LSEEQCSDRRCQAVFANSGVRCINVPRRYNNNNNNGLITTNTQQKKLTIATQTISSNISFRQQFATWRKYDCRSIAVGVEEPRPALKHANHVFKAFNYKQFNTTQKHQ
jgi:hypothetical protein